MGRAPSNTCFWPHLINSLVLSHQLDPVDLGDDEKTGCRGPERTGEDRGGPWGAHMTQGHWPLEAFPLFPSSGLLFEGLGDFLPPPTRQTDVERSPVPRAQDTAACCPPPPPVDLALPSDRRATEPLTTGPRPVRCRVQACSALLPAKLSKNEDMASPARR